MTAVDVQCCLDVHGETDYQEDSAARDAHKQLTTAGERQSSVHLLLRPLSCEDCRLQLHLRFSHYFALLCLHVCLVWQLTVVRKKTPVVVHSRRTRCS